MEILSSRIPHPDFGTISCKRSDYAATKTRVAHTLQSTMKYGFVHDAAVCLTKAFLKQFEGARGKERESFASSFEGHHERIWDKAVIDANITTKINTQSNRWLTSAIGTSWADWQKCGYQTEEAWVDAIKQERLEFLIAANRDIITLFVRAIFGDDRNQSDVYRDAVRTIILSKANTDLLEGNYDTNNWLDKIWLQPAVQTWTLFMFRFEGITDAQNLNLAAEFREALQIVAGTTGTSVRQLDLHLQQTCDLQTRLWSYLPSFFRQFRAQCLS